MRAFLTQRIFRRWGLHLLAAASLSTLAVALVFQNRFGVLPVKRMALAALLVLPAFAALAFLSNTLFPPERKLPGGSRLLPIALAACVVLVWLAPLPILDLPQNHQLVIEATGEKEPRATNSLVEIRELRFLNGQRIRPEQMLMTPDWQSSGEVLFTRGSPGSRLEIRGEMPGGILLRLRYSEEGGQAQITWDGEKQAVDLFSASGTVLARAFSGGLANLSLPQAVLMAGFWLLYLLGMLALVLCALLALVYFLPERWEQAAYWLALVGLAVIFLYFKASYLSIDMPRVFRDSYLYVATAEEPLFSQAFFLGQRSFTLPLFLKSIGANTTNYETPGQLLKMARVQTVLSALCWIVLAVTLLRTTKLRWLRLALFGGALAFSLTPEVSLWDALLLSESLSFSLFALLVACWVWLLARMPGERRAWARWLGVGVTFLISLLFTFIRESNIYLILLMAVVLALGAQINRRLARSRLEIWSMAGLMVFLLLVQNLAMSTANRWQIFMYDHLAMRILHDPEATRFFVQEGLPMSDLLMRTTQMSGVEYQNAFYNAPEMASVRDWVTKSSKGVYMRYLLSNPLRSLGEPLENTNKLINGSNLEYRSPAYAVTPIPSRLAQLNALFFFHQPWLLALLGLAALAGVTVYLIKGGTPVWVVIAGWLISVYPLMFLIWHAEPLEIERHAANLLIQSRMAIWLAAAYWIETAVMAARGRFYQTSGVFPESANLPDGR